MKILKQLLFTIAVMLCFSIAATAQDQDKKPKKVPPVVVVKEKKPKEDKPKEDKPKKDNEDNVKKPPMEFYLSENRIELVSI